jgi:hypothetical protein
VFKILVFKEARITTQMDCIQTKLINAAYYYQLAGSVLIAYSTGIDIKMIFCSDRGCRREDYG